MENKKLLFIGAILSCTQINAQQAVVTSGGNALGNNGNISYSMGQVNYTTVGSVVLGMQQPFEIQTLLGIENSNINLELNIYPNPTTSLLNLLVKDYNSEPIQYQLFDFNGRLLVDDKIIAASTIIQMEQYPNAVYLLKVLESNKEVKTFKIMKTN
jgi:hypothetical protein